MTKKKQIDENNYMALEEDDYCQETEEVEKNNKKCIMQITRESSGTI